MISEIFFVSGVGLLIGLIIGYFITQNKRILRKINKEEKKKHQILTDHELLLSKIKNSGEVISDGYKILPEFEKDEKGRPISFKTVKTSKK